MKINKTVTFGTRDVEYTLEYKSVKNINLRVKYDGSVYVSANKRVPAKKIEEFIISHSDFILNALEKCEKIKREIPKAYRTEEELRAQTEKMCKEVYPYYEMLGVKFPQIKFRKMVSRWGSCNTKKHILTFNTNLICAPIECVEYVVFHEFTHFLHPNHSKLFYFELQKVCPDWKECRKRLREIIL